MPERRDMVSCLCQSRHNGNSLFLLEQGHVERVPACICESPLLLVRCCVVYGLSLAVTRSIVPFFRCILQMLEIGLDHGGNRQGLDKAGTTFRNSIGVSHTQCDAHVS